MSAPVARSAGRRSAPVARSARRALLRAGALAAVLVPLGCASAGRLPLRVIDAHVHADFDTPEEAGMPYTLERLQREWQEARVQGAVVHLPAGSARPLAVPGTIRYCAGIGDDPDLAALEEALRSGAVACMKIYLGYVYHYPNDPIYQPVYRLAARYRVPVVFHTGDTSSSRAKLKYADPMGVDEVAVDHPDATFVIAHCGNPWLDTAAEVAYKNPNVYIECSALMVGDLSRLAERDLRRYVTDVVSYVFGYVEDPKKLMFATDWPLVDVRSYLRAYAAAIPEESWDDVFYGNAARIFGFPPP